MKTFFFYCSLFLIAIAGILAIMLFFYWALLHPLWGIADAIASDEKSSEARVLWVVVMFFTWTLGSLIYTFLASHSIRLKKSTIFCAIASGAVVVVLGIGGILAAVTYPEDSTIFPQTTNTSNEETSLLNTTNVNVKSKCLGSATWMFSHDAVRVCENPTPHTPECLRSATWMFSHDAVEICEDAKAETAQCLAQSSSMFSHDAVQACQ
jgi:hypothetical protein